jgi:hypothetical protein
MRAAPRSAQDLNSRAADLQLMGIVEGITRSFSRSAAMISVLRLRSLAKPIVPLTSASDPSCRRHGKVPLPPRRRQFGSPARCSSEEPKSTEAEREQ